MQSAAATNWKFSTANYYLSGSLEQERADHLSEQLVH